MKYIIRLFVLTLFFSACSESQNSEAAYPEDLEGKKALLKEKRSQLAELTKTISQLETEIGELDPASKIQSKRLVTVSKVERSDFQRFVEVQGAVDADDLVDVTSEVSGRILSLKVKEGQSVKKGQLVAKLDLEQLKKQMAEIEKALELANTVFERQSRLWDQNIGSEIQYLEAKNSKERLEKNLETLSFQLEKSDVFAPISGIIDREVLQSGEIAIPGAPIVQILNTRKLKVVVDVPENYLRSVQKGEQVKVSFPALELDQNARINLIGRTIDAANRTFKVEANLASTNKLIKPNLLAIMYIKDFEAKDVVAIPLEIVQQEVSGKDFVFIKQEGKDGPFAKKVYVETDKSYEGSIIITKGLQGGEELILEGARGVAENELIEVQNTKIVVSNG